MCLVVESTLMFLLFTMPHTRQRAPFGCRNPRHQCGDSMEPAADTKLELFIKWLQVNGAKFRSCKIKYCGPQKGYGVFASDDNAEGILLVVPLDLAITPMRVLQEPHYAAKCRPLFEEGDVDDRFLMMLFLTVERATKNSSWKPYLDMLPSTFASPLWFTERELLELKGTTLFKATVLQKKKLEELFNHKLKPLAEELIRLHGDSGSVVHFEDFLWANSIFWTRALNIPLPHSFVFPQMAKDPSEDMESPVLKDSSGNGVEEESSEVASTQVKSETVWVEGLVPGIDFCNHNSEPCALWEIDASGCTAGIPLSMCLLSAHGQKISVEKEIFISYGNKGNEELLYLYGFVLEKKPDDFLMVHYPIRALQETPCADTKQHLLAIQKAELRCLLPKSLLQRGFFPMCLQTQSSSVQLNADINNYSWCGQRKTPSYLNKLVFPEVLLTALRTIAMQEHEVFQVSSLLEELIGFSGQREPSESEVRAAVWEVCGDAGALQLLVDLLNVKKMELEEGSGSEDEDSKLLQDACTVGVEESVKEHGRNNVKVIMSKNEWSAVVYRYGQKQLTRLFLREAEHALQICLSTE